MDCTSFDFSAEYNWHSAHNINVVWFQCPWNQEDTPDLLIADFMKHMRSQQNQGDYFIIGIAEIYEKRYDLPKLFEVFSDGY